MLWVVRIYVCLKGVREGIQFIRVPYKRPTSTHVLSEMSGQEKC